MSLKTLIKNLTRPDRCDCLLGTISVSSYGVWQFTCDKCKKTEPVAGEIINATAFHSTYRGRYEA